MRNTLVIFAEYALHTRAGHVTGIAKTNLTPIELGTSVTWLV